jgi:hypothetical protein
MTDRWTITVPDELAERVEAELSYGDSRSEWVCDAMRARLACADDSPDTDRTRAREGAAAPPEGHVVQRVDLPSQVDEAAAAAAVDAAVAHLRDHGPATMRELVSSVGVEHPLGYDVPETIPSGERYRGAWWRRVVRPALDEHPAVAAPQPGQSEWRFTGE